MISLALIDNKISDEEYIRILNEFIKEEIRLNSMNMINEEAG